MERVRRSARPARRDHVGARRGVRSVVPSGERDPGELVETPVDLPPGDEWDDEGQTARGCDQLDACIVGPTAAGSVVLGSIDDFALLADIRCVYGSLTISGPGIFDLRGLEHIEVVCGPIEIRENPDLVDTVGLDGLDGSGLVLHSVALAGNPRLTRVTLPPAYAGHVGVTDSPLLLDLQGLAELAELSVTLQNCDGVERLGPFLTMRGAVRARDNDSLTAIDVPSLVEGELEAVGNPGLTEIVLPSAAELERVEFTGTGLTAFPSLPAAQLGEVRIDANQTLADISTLSATASIERLVVLGNPLLDQVATEELARSVAASHKVAGNAGWDVPASCPFEGDHECDALGCDGSVVCPEASDQDDCAPCGGG